MRRKWAYRHPAFCILLCCAPALLATGFVLAAGGQWDGSSVTADPPAVDLARQPAITFTVSLVNAGPPADDLLLVCSAEDGHILTVADAYTAGNRIQWVRDVPVGTTSFSFHVHPISWPTMRVPCSIYDDGDLQHIFTGTVGVEPMCLYLPLATRDYAPLAQTTVVTVPISPGIDAVSWSSGGPDHAGAYAPDGSGVFGEQGAGLGTALFPLDYGSYWMTRGYLAVAIPDLGPGRVITAGLSLVPCAAWTTYQDPLPPPVISFHPGTWPGLLADGRTMWGAWDGTRVGEFDTTPIFGLDCYAGETGRVVIPLDAGYIHPGRVFKLVVRDGEDDVDLRTTMGERNRWFSARSLAYGATGDVWLEIGLRR